MVLGDNGNRSNFGLNSAIIYENQEIMRVVSPNSDVVREIPKGTDLNLIQSNSTGTRKRVLAIEERIGRTLHEAG